MTAWRTSASLAVALALPAGAAPLQAYLKFGVRVNGQDVVLRWNTAPVRYVVADAGVPGVSAADFQAAVARAFGTWQAVPSATIAYQFVGFTAALPGDEDGLSTLGFHPEPELDRVLAATAFLVDDATGEILESDIFFNSLFQWSVAPGGTPGRVDVESIALHEIGHLSGLGHSAIGETEQRDTGPRVIAAEAVMFPIAFPLGSIAGRTLRPDDVAGLSDLYPENAFTDGTGSVSGRVTRNGAGILGAHVVAFSPATGAMVGNFTLTPQGTFSIAGLSPGPHVLRVEPLDDPSAAMFFGDALAVDIDFKPAFHERLVVVPAGGDGGAVEIPVVRK